MAIDRFDGDNFYLSNFYNASIMYDGISYKNNEAAFQAQKTLNKAEREQFSNLQPNEAKKLGRRIALRSDWEEVKDEIMFDIVLTKFSSHPELKKKLIATNGFVLVEGNTWHDNYWGNCTCDRCENLIGKNVLGRTLLNVRRILIG